MRKLLAALIFAATLVAGITPAIAQAPPAVPALPDAERRTAYTISSQTGPFDANFAIYGDGVDYGAWIEVWLNGVRLTPVTDWTLALTSGTLATAARPLTNARVTLVVAGTGDLEIVGARRPRRLSQFNENQGVTARALNQTITDLVAQNRETWDKLNDVTGRTIVAPPGETLTVLPKASDRASLFLGFDALGQVSLLAGVGGGVTSLGGMTGVITCGANLTCSAGSISATGGGGTGTVTSVATTSPITGGTFTTTGIIGCATCVTSAAALTANQIVIGAGLQASAVTTTGTGVLTALGVNVGSAGAFVTFNGALGTPSSGTATNLTGLPVGSGISGLGTGVATALAVNVGSAGSFVTFNGALGTPSSGTVTNLTGTATININGTVGATSQNTGQFTTLTATTINAFTLAGTIAGGGNQINNVIIGNSTPLAGSFTAIVGTSAAINGTVTVTSASASAFTAGRLGATTPAFKVDASTATSITGVQVKSAATTAGVDLTAIGETNVDLRINAAGNGQTSIAATSTGSVSIGNGSATVLTLSPTQTRVMGSASVALTFKNDNLSGFGNRDSTTFDFSAWANSAEVMRWTQTNITAFTSISGVSAGSTIAFGFNGDANTGIYSSATDTINFAVQGHSIFQITENTVGVPFVTATAGVIVNPARTIASASGAIWSDIEVSPATTTFTGTTTVDAIARVAIFSGTLAQTGAGTMTVTLAEGLYVEPPTAGTDVTITNAFAARFAGNVYLNAGSYINFSGTSGTGGYGVRDNGGTIECKNSGGAWAACAGGGGGGATVCTTTALSVQYNAAGSLGCVSGVTSDGTLMQHAAGSFALRDSSAAFNVLINATDPATISATRTLTLGMGNVSHTVNFGTTANTITFPNAASDTVVMVAAAQTLTNKTLTSPALGGTVTGSNTIPLTILAQSAANTMLGNWTGSTANVSANTMPSCADTGTNHLNYVSGSGITCGTAGVGLSSSNAWTGTNSFTNVVAIENNRTVASATGVAWNDFVVSDISSGITITGTTTITKFVQTNFFTTAITNANGLTITDAGTVYIKGAPTFGGAGGTFTNGPWGLWVDNNAGNGGRVKFSDATASTSKTTGALIVGGGVGIAGATFTDTLSVITMANTATTSAVCYNTGTGLFTYNGTVGTCTVSDNRLKNVDGPLVGALAKILQIKGVYFHWKDQATYGSGRQVGIVAQDVAMVFPELVSTDSEGKMSADYQRLTAPIIEAMRELKAENDNLHAANDNLSQRIDVLENARR